MSGLYLTWRGTQKRPLFISLAVSVKQLHSTSGVRRQETTKKVKQKNSFISNIKRFLVYMKECVDETPDYVKNQAFFKDLIWIQAYSEPWKHKSSN